MTNDLISREALLIEMAAGCMPLNEKGISGVTGDESTIADYIKNAPSVDAAPVMHARWVWADDGYCRCSNCTQKAPVMTQYQDEPTTTMTDYCPHCGAKMDKEADNAQE